MACLKPFFAQNSLGKESVRASAETALAIQSILSRHWKVQFWDDDDARKQAINEIDDYLFDEVKGAKGIELSLDQMDELIEQTLQVARHRSALLIRVGDGQLRSRNRSRFKSCMSSVRRWRSQCTRQCGGHKGAGRNHLCPKWNSGGANEPAGS